jgi:hypothetical protein
MRLLLIFIWFNPVALMVHIKPPEFVIDALNHLRRTQKDRDTFYLRKYGWLMIRDPYSMPTDAFYARRWHLFSWKF